MGSYLLVACFPDDIVQLLREIDRPQFFNTELVKVEMIFVRIECGMFPAVTSPASIQKPDVETRVRVHEPCAVEKNSNKDNCSGKVPRLTRFGL